MRSANRPRTRLNASAIADESTDAIGCIASLFNPVLYPGGGDYLEITQEELGLLSGITRQVANQSLKALQQDGVVRLEYGRITVVDLERLRNYGA